MLCIVSALKRMRGIVSTLRISISIFIMNHSFKSIVAYLSMNYCVCKGKFFGKRFLKKKEKRGLTFSQLQCNIFGNTFLVIYFLNNERLVSMMNFVQAVYILIIILLISAGSPALSFRYI